MFHILEFYQMEFMLYQKYVSVEKAGSANCWQTGALYQSALSKVVLFTCAYCYIVYLHVS